MTRRISRHALTVVLGALVLLAPPAGAQRLAPIVYTLSFPAPESHVAVVVATIPTGRAATVDLMLPVWSPGYYVQEDYVRSLHRFVARDPAGDSLNVEQPQPNRWRVTTRGAATITLTYELECSRPTVTGNSVGADYAVINGAPTFVTLVEHARRSHEVRIALPAQWHQTATSLAGAGTRTPDDYVATSYDELVDSPIIIGNIRMHEFVVGGSTHYLADVGDIPATYSGDSAAAKLEKIARADARFWGGLPFKKYVFLNVFRRGGGGLEHLNSTLLTSSPQTETGTSLRWLDYVAHEYFHAENVKRFRPVELGPFDYEHAPTTAGLWLAEGVTSYYGELLVSRSGVGTVQDFLGTLSAAIAAVQNRPGRLVQTLEQASLGIFATGGSGIGGDAARTVSYYDKGQVVGWVLDARIQHASKGWKSLDDFMRLGMRRFGGARGYTPEDLVTLASELAGTDLTEFMRKALRSTEELDYSEALAWFGLRFAPSADATKAWTLEVRADATPAQQKRLQALAGKVSLPLPAPDPAGRAL
jgi:predicted metalloprotease with PDZ domain